MAALAARHSICEIKWREVKVFLIQMYFLIVQLKVIGTPVVAVTVTVIGFSFSSQSALLRLVFRQFKMTKKAECSIGDILNAIYTNYYQDFTIVKFDFGEVYV